MVHIEGITKSFGSKTVLQNFSLNLEQGERFVLLGRSGCGKTTLLRLIAGFDRPDRGSIAIEGKPINLLPIEQRPIGFIFQRHALFPHMTVYDNIAVGPRVRGVDESTLSHQIDELLEMIRLTSLRAAWPNQLSGGESQRVALARALINRPKVLLLDEPLSALDENLRQNLREELTRIQEACGITFLFVTHDRAEAMSLADRMAVLEGGRLLQVGTPQELYDQPRHPFVASFLGDVNRLTGKVERMQEGRIFIAMDGLQRTFLCAKTSEIAIGTAVECYIRPEKITLLAENQNTAEPNQLPGLLENRIFFGDHFLYKIKLDNGKRLNVHKVQPVPFKIGDRVKVVIKSSDIFLFPSLAGEANG